MDYLLQSSSVLVLKRQNQFHSIWKLESNRFEFEGERKKDHFKNRELSLFISTSEKKISLSFQEGIVSGNFYLCKLNDMKIATIYIVWLFNKQTKIEKFHNVTLTLCPDLKIPQTKYSWIKASFNFSVKWLFKYFLRILTWSYE